MDGEQNAFGFVHFSLQVLLECTCSADLWPKLIETSHFLRKTDVSLCILSAPGAPNELQSLVSADPNATLGCSIWLENNSIPWMGSKISLESPTLALKFHSNAHALPICCPNSLKPHSFLRKTDVSPCILGAPDARTERQHLVSGGPKSTSGCSLPS